MTHFALGFEAAPSWPGVGRSGFKSSCILAPCSIEKQAVDLRCISAELLFSRRAVEWRDGSLRHFTDTFPSKAAEHRQHEARPEC